MRSLVVSTGMLLAITLSSADAQERLAAYQRLDVPRGQQRVTFAKQPAAEGDRVDQTLAVELQLNSTVRQGNQALDQKSSSLARAQQRTVIAHEVIDGRTVAAQVHFGDYERTVDGKTSKPPVVGNSYLCRREADDTLTVTRADGSFASPDEFAIVSQSMESLGRANPLADFLGGRTVAVGEMLDLPLEVGAALLGSNDSLGQVARFTLTLSELEPNSGVARFAVEMETEGADTTQMRLIVTGDLDVETTTCRTQRLELAGPLGMASTSGSYSIAQTTFVRGKLIMKMTAEYN